MVVAGPNWTCGADLGGSKLSIVLSGADGSVPYRAWTGYEPGLPGILSAVAQAVRAASDWAAQIGGQVCALGLAIAAWLSLDRSTILVGANIGAEQADLRQGLMDRLDMPVLIENDGDATAWAEYCARQPRPTCLALFTLGTGVGGGIVERGRLLSGGLGLGGELGHLPVAVGRADQPCVCGGTACLELSASGKAIAAKLGLPSASDAVARAQAGEAEAITAFEQAGHALGQAIKLLVPTLSPQLVVLAGSVGHGASRWLLPSAQQELLQGRPLARVAGPPAVEPGRLGPYAGAVGAAYLALPLGGVLGAITGQVGP